MKILPKFREFSSTDFADFAWIHHNGRPHTRPRGRPFARRPRPSTSARSRPRPSTLSLSWLRSSTWATLCPHHMTPTSVCSRPCYKDIGSPGPWPQRCLPALARAAPRTLANRQTTLGCYGTRSPSNLGPGPGPNNARPAAHWHLQPQGHRPPGPSPDGTGWHAQPQGPPANRPTTLDCPGTFSPEDTGHNLDHAWPPAHWFAQPRGHCPPGPNNARLPQQVQPRGPRPTGQRHFWRSLDLRSLSSSHTRTLMRSDEL
ncbi:unnamed protein product [Sphagnum tenellum]